MNGVSAPAPTPGPALPDGQRVVFTEYGENPPEAIAAFSRLDVQPAPDPATLGPREVLLRVRSVAVSWVDVLMTSGQYQHLPPPPWTPGMDYAGEVVATGAAVDPTRCAPGARVIADFFQVGPRSGGAYRQAGGFATWAVVPDEAVYPIPGDLDFDEACNLLGPYETAWHGLVARARLRPGESVLVTGASGATGLAAVQVARLLGATVIAAGRDDTKLAAVRAQGAAHTVTVGDGAGGVRPFRDDIKALTGGRGVDVVYDTVGGAVSLECLRATAFDARFLIVGWTSTPDVARGRGLRGAPRANQLPTHLIQMKSLNVLGCPMVIATTRDPAIRKPRLTQVLQWAAEGRIRPQVSHRLPLGSYREAMLARWGGEVTGGCVLHP